MIEKNLKQRFTVIALVVVFAVMMIWPPWNGCHSRLAGGLDIAGGVSLIYEINEEGSDDPALAETMKTLLQRRIDPQGVYNLVWRVLGRNRIEIQMPQPPKDAADRRKALQDAKDELFKTKIQRSQLESAFALAPEQRAGEFDRLSDGSAERKTKIEEAAKRFDEWRAAIAAKSASQPTSTEPAEGGDKLAAGVRDALERYSDAVDEVLATNIDPTRFNDILELDTAVQKQADTRRQQLEQLIAQHPRLKDKIEAVVARHQAWSQFKGVLDGPEELQRLLRGAGVLEFRILTENTPDNAAKIAYYRDQLAKQGPRPSKGDTDGWFRIDNPTGFLNIEPPNDISTFDAKRFQLMVVDKYNEQWYVLGKLGDKDGLLRTAKRHWRLTEAGPQRDEHGRLAVAFRMDANGGQQFGELTGANIEKQLCILLDDVAYSSARINSQIFERGQITGEFSREKVQYLVQSMQAGALPARLKDTPISTRVLGSSLGAENLRQSLRAGLIGAGLVILLMAGYYLFCGMVANVAMLLNVLFVMAVMCMLNAKFTLDGIAGVILGIGMAVDSNVLIYERMREEKERGGSLRMIIKNGYDKAMSTIIDSHVTTLLTCVILYYVGSEEVKGFGLTLGWGVVMNLFTAVFVTRTIFAALVKYNVIKDIKINKLIGVPNIDWFGLRKVFIPISIIITVAGLVLMFTRESKDYLDVEFLGGLSADIETRGDGLSDKTIRNDLKEAGVTLAQDARKLAEATVTATPNDPTSFVIHVPGLDAGRIEVFLTEPLEESRKLQRGGISSVAGTNEITIKANEGATADGLQKFVRDHAPTAQKDGELLVDASVSSVKESGESDTNNQFWNITTTITNKRFVQEALRIALKDKLQIQPRVKYAFRGEDGKPYPIVARRLEEVIKGLPTDVSADLGDFVGGAAIYMDQLTPPLAVDGGAGSLYDRLRNMRLQPGFQDFPWRNFKVIGITPAGKDSAGRDLYSGAVIVVVDDHYPYDDPERWMTEFAGKELELAQATLDTETSLRKITQFKPQIAAQASTQATIALVLSWLMIIVYLWMRFGKPVYGLAGVAALVHDVLVALAFVGFSGLIGGAGKPGHFLMIEDFKINMPIIAALLTIIGYSINDTIVIFDRIREDRGRLGVVTPKIINDAINQTMSRTIITVLTVFLTLLAMYIFGGSGTRGFSYCMLVGTMTGAYSSIAVAAPLLLLGMRREDAANTKPAGR